MAVAVLIESWVCMVCVASERAAHGDVERVLRNVAQWPAWRLAPGAIGSAAFVAETPLFIFNLQPFLCVRERELCSCVPRLIPTSWWSVDLELPYVGEERRGVAASHGLLRVRVDKMPTRVAALGPHHGGHAYLFSTQSISPLASQQ
uniref:Secreted protein n=1 Tax=Oryza nivara TaxID=4536 RepID=A0A0E0INV3_ORYNI